MHNRRWKGRERLRRRATTTRRTCGCTSGDHGCWRFISSRLWTSGSGRHHTIWITECLLNIADPSPSMQGSSTF